jgi:hypothetical protein
VCEVRSLWFRGFLKKQEKVHSTMEAEDSGY